MEERLSAYEEKQKSIRLKNAHKKKSFGFGISDSSGPMRSPSRQVPVYDFVQLGSKVVIGAGPGLLAGVAAIAVVASAAEVVIAGVVAKIAGVVGGSVALSLGLRDLKSKREKRDMDILRS
jgi:hypothetical protein